MNRWKTLVPGAVMAGLIVCTLWGCGGSRSTEEPAPTIEDTRARVGRKAPDFQGDFAVNGEPVKLSDLRGKVVLVDFWALWCQPCIEALPQLVQLNAKYKARGLEVVGVLLVDPKADRHLGFDKKSGKVIRIEDLTRDAQREMFKDFAVHHKIDYLVMTLPEDEAKRAFVAYELRAIPRMALIDRKGIVKKLFVGGGPIVAREIEDEVKKLVEG